ncbi:hypothetical protein [Oryzifoliimicrobium ureilyticus]|uniref:hypothetical protein n=1 Tax=Oryzifoliimicrobium ureilyticus TaxID=3113724 RepID=UPI0030763F06
MASSLLAVAMVPVVLLLSSFSIFNPWYWYVVLNKDRLEQMAETKPVADDGNYKILSDWDIVARHRRAQHQHLRCLDLWKSA